MPPAVLNLVIKKLSLLSQHLAGGTKDSHKKIQCHSQDSNHKPPEYTSEVSPLQPVYLVIAELKIRVDYYAGVN